MVLRPGEGSLCVAAASFVMMKGKCDTDIYCISIPKTDSYPTHSDSREKEANTELLIESKCFGLILVVQKGGTDTKVKVMTKNVAHFLVYCIWHT